MYAACSGADDSSCRYPRRMLGEGRWPGNGSSIYAFYDIRMLLNSCDKIKPGDTVLIKGSRGMKMEYVADYLRERDKL